MSVTVAPQSNHPMAEIMGRLPRGLQMMIESIAGSSTQPDVPFMGPMGMVKGLTPLVGSLPKKGLLPAVLTKEKGLFVGQEGQSHPEIIQEFLDELSGETRSSFFEPQVSRLFPNGSGRLRRTISKYWDPQWNKEYGSGYATPEGNFLTRSEAAQKAIEDKLTLPAIRSVLRERGNTAQLHSGHLMREF